MLQVLFAVFAASAVQRTVGSFWSCATIGGGYNLTANRVGTEWLSASKSGGQEPEIHCGKHKATVESDIRPLHSHTGTPDQWSTGRSHSP